MSYPKNTRKVYYHILRGSRYLIADERNKRKLIDTVSHVRREESWLIYAFCLTDDCAYFITEVSGIQSLQRGMRRAADEFLFECAPYLPHQGGQAATLNGGMTEELGSLREIADRCREIHRLPLEKGYVHRLDDYWWSSYITYIGEYDWTLVDCHVLSLYFSVDPELSRKNLQRFHQEL